MPSNVLAAGRAVLGSALLLLASLNGTALQAGEVVDATGARVSIATKPLRIVTLAPSLGELVADVLGGKLERLVGVSEYTDYPPGIEKISSVGSYARFNVEKVVSLKPDLVLATRDGNLKDQVLRLRELKLPVVVVDTGNFAQVASSMKLVAEAMASPEAGAAMAARFEKGLAEVKARAKVRGSTALRVLLQIGDDPLVVVGGGTFLQDALEAVGAANLYADAKATYPRPSVEDIVSRDPGAILVLALGHDLVEFEKMAAKWKRFPKLKAVRDSKVRVLQGDAVLRPTSRLIEGLGVLEKAVHGAR